MALSIGNDSKIEEKTSHSKQFVTFSCSSAQCNVKQNHDMVKLRGLYFFVACYY